MSTLPGSCSARFLSRPQKLATRVAVEPRTAGGLTVLLAIHGMNTGRVLVLVRFMLSIPVAYPSAGAGALLGGIFGGGKGAGIGSVVGGAAGLGTTAFHGRQKVTLNFGQEMLIRIKR